jgi:hypothetical protein
MSRRSALHMTATDVVAHQSKHGFPPPVELRPNLPDPAELRKSLPKRKGDRRLKEHRKPNDTEARYALVLEAMKRRGEIEYYGFEEITLRWADMTYTPDFFIIREERAQGDRTFVEAVYVEIKGGHKWEDSIIKWKAARARFTWARFEMWQCVSGQWSQIG